VCRLNCHTAYQHGCNRKGPSVGWFGSLAALLYVNEAPFAPWMDAASLVACLGLCVEASLIANRLNAQRGLEILY
jgi:hypothetical protein